jgi:sec-independent protein translocase protein TatB
MFDLDFSKLALIGVVALVVLGPERLPRVARTAGALLGRAQRYLNDVKAEVTREIELDELRKVKTGVETAAANLHNTIHNTVQSQATELTDAWNNGAVMAPREAAASLEEIPAASSPAASASYARPAAAPRRNWRSKRSAVPAWYKQANQKRQAVVSNAARVALAARQASAGSDAAPDTASGRRPIRFL